MATLPGEDDAAALEDGAALEALAAAELEAAWEPDASDDDIHPTELPASELDVTVRELEEPTEEDGARDEAGVDVLAMDHADESDEPDDTIPLEGPPPEAGEDAVPLDPVWGEAVGPEELKRNADAPLPCEDTVLPPPDPDVTPPGTHPPCWHTIPGEHTPPGSHTLRHVPSRQTQSVAHAAVDRQGNSRESSAGNGHPSMAATPNAAIHLRPCLLQLPMSASLGCPAPAVMLPGAPAAATQIRRGPQWRGHGGTMPMSSPSVMKPRANLETDARALRSGRELLSGLHPTILMQGEELLLAWGRAVNDVHQSLHAPLDFPAWARAEQRRYQARAAWNAFLRALPV